jgi:hypothetical protein
MIEAQEAKKTPQEEIKVTPPKAKVSEEVKPEETTAEDQKTTESE